jgi:hypothetical protein
MTKYLYRKPPLYRKAGHALALAAAMLVLSSSLAAQLRVPQPERKTPRAIAVLETFKNGSRRLLPVTFFYERHYYDANFYHATPVPFTLYSETVYEVQQFGKPLGTFTVQSATESAAQWYGNGRFKVAPDAAALAKKAAPKAVVVEDPSRPVLHRRQGSEGDTPSVHPKPAAGTPEAEDDPDRPKLHRRQGSESDSQDRSAQPGAQPPAAAQDSASAQTPAPTQAKALPSQPEGTSGQDPNRPKLHRKDDSTATRSSTPAATAPANTATAAPENQKSPAQSANQPPSQAVAAKPELTPSDDPDHPILRRGKPVQEQGGRDLPDFSREEPVIRQVAVSDAGVSESQPLIYVCPEPERRQIEESSRELARAELRRLASQRGLRLPTPPQATTSIAQKRKTAVVKPAPLPEFKLEDEHFVPYDLDYNNFATVVFSARYTPVGGQATAPGAMHANGWVVTVVARQDEDKLVKLYSAVSDPRELDLYPEVRLVDAVDPDGYGRMALLFRERKRDGVSWLLARPTGYELQTVFETPAR